MAPMQHTARINLQEFKSKFYKLLGPAKESRYCGLLSSFLSYQLTKGELDRLVPSTIGKENLVLHNQFVHAIFTNAYCAEAPVRPSSINDISKPVKGIHRKPVTPSELSSLPLSPGLQPIRSNGEDGFIILSRKGRSGNHVHKAAERSSPLGNHRREAATLEGTPSEDDIHRSLEDANLDSPDLLRPSQQSNTVFEQSSLDDCLSSPPSKRPRYCDHHLYANSKSAGIEPTHVEMEQEEEMEEEEDEEDVEDEDEEQGIIWMSSYIQPPLGIPFCIPSLGSAGQAASVTLLPSPIKFTMLGDALDSDCLNASELPDTETMQQRIQQGAVFENGMQGVTIDCANVVNLALDLYLKALMKLTIELVQSKRSGSREKSGSSKENGGVGYLQKELKQEASLFPEQKHVSRIWPHNSTRVPADGTLAEGEEKGFRGITPLDFYVAMDLHHHLLGENFPINLERILLHVSPE
jgi:hypothetical protein